MSCFGDFVDITLFQVSVGDNIPNSWLLKIGHFPTPPLNFRALYFQTRRPQEISAVHRGKTPPPSPTALGHRSAVGRMDFHGNMCLKMGECTP